MYSKHIIIVIIVATICIVEGQIEKTLKVNFNCQVILTVNLIPYAAYADFTINQKFNIAPSCCFLTKADYKNVDLSTTTQSFVVANYPIGPTLQPPISPVLIINTFNLGINKDLVDLTYYGYIKSGYCAGSNITIHSVYEQSELSKCRDINGLASLEATYFSAEFTSGLCQGNCKGNLGLTFSPAIASQTLERKTTCNTVYPDCYYEC